MFFAYRMMLAAFTLVSHAGAFKPEPPFKALAQMSGANSSIEIPRIVVIRDQAAWSQLWSEHRSSFKINVPSNAKDDDTDRPKVNFDDKVMICVFGGQSKNVGGFSVAQAGDVDNVAYVRLSALLLPASGTAILQNPFIFVLVPKTKRKTIVQLDQSAFGGEGWRTLSTIEPTKH